MKYEFKTATMKGTYVKAYIARITGPHEKYVFNRRFIRHSSYDTEYGQKIYVAQIGSRGVFEICFRYCDRQTYEMVRRIRKYFVLDSGTTTNIKRCQVLKWAEKLK